MSLFVSFSIYCIVCTYIGVFYLRFYHYIFLYNNPIAAITECPISLTITTFLILIVLLIEHRIIRKFENAIKKGEEKEILKCYNKFNTPLIIAYTIGFVLGTGGTSLVEGLTGKVPFEPIITILITIQGIAVGLLGYTVTIYRIKKIRMGKMLKDVGLKNTSFNLNQTLQICIIGSILLTTIDFIMVPIWLLKNPVDNILKRYIFDCILSTVMNSCACIVCYSMLIKSIQKTDRDLKSTLFEETQNLAVATKESAATGQDQAAAIKEIVATVENSNSLNVNVNNKISNVSELAEKSKDDVISGIEFLKHSFEDLMNTISQSNQNTILGIKELDTKIDSIWDIVSVINDFADQTKIIAFNSELKANEAGKAGKQFHIVATEVRRLSDRIIDSIREIKEKVTEIQKSSASLITTGEKGAKSVEESYSSIKLIEERFENIKLSSESTAVSAEDIKDFMNQLSTASEQILITIKQIAVGVENFSESTENISKTSEKLKELAGQM
ncbi:MAG: hypothetical protein K5829_01015 [Treponema sp.]|nr:hypothetical protein [Treponema sp.]